jgi:hypothetical protein
VKIEMTKAETMKNQLEEEADLMRHCVPPGQVSHPSEHLLQE